jgi:hypothetical protein
MQWTHALGAAATCTGTPAAAMRTAARACRTSTSSWSRPRGDLGRPRRRLGRARARRRSGGDGLLQALAYDMPPQFVDPLGAPLSDHSPVSAVAAWSLVREPGAAALLALGLLALARGAGSRAALAGRSAAR